MAVMLKRGLLAAVLFGIFNQCSAFNYGEPNEVQTSLPAGTDYAVITSTTKPKVGDTITFVNPDGSKQVSTITEIYEIKVISGGRRLKTEYQARLKFSPATTKFVPQGATVVISAEEEKWCDKMSSYADYAAMNKNQKKAWEACKLGCTGADYALIGKNTDWKKVAAVCKANKKLEQKFEAGANVFYFQGLVSVPMMAGMAFIVSLGLVAAGVTALRRQRRQVNDGELLLNADSDDNVAE